tara:strand:- start:12183 stop:13709 length:1527 start_codon:yes stop_codon:yes gene_type:complete
MKTVSEKQISRATRKKMARVAKRTQKKRMMAKKRMAKRVKNPKQLRQLAQKQAKAIVVKKMTGGKSYSQLPITAKEKIEKKLSKKPGLINRIAKKLMPKVKAKEKKRLAKVRAQNKPNPLTEVETSYSSKDGKHGVLTLNVNGSQPEVSARYVNGNLEPYVFKTRKDAKKHTDKVGGKPFESMDTGLFYVEFTRLDGPVSEQSADGMKVKNPETGRNIKVSSALAYGTDEPVYKKAVSLVSKAKDVVKKKIPKKQAIKNGIKDFFKKASTEKDETVQSMKILSKYATGKKVSDDEKKYVADQFKDIMKMAGMGAVAAAPGGSIAVPLLVKAAKKMNVDLMPSAFQKENFTTEGIDYKTANEIKKDWKKQYPNDKFTFKKVRAKGNEFLMVLSPKGVELERYQFVPKTGWTEMNENKDNEKDVKELKAMLDIAKMLSDKSPYFKGRGSKKEYIKMLVHKIQKLSEAKKQKLMTKMDAYKKVRKPIMPKSRPMKNKKAYDRKDLKKGKYD